jgi:hypothetical protein
MILSIVGLVISIFAFLLSGLTAWFSLLNRGKVCMTQPTVIYFGPDGGRRDGPLPGHPKVFFRALLYSTGKRGRVVENMFVTLRRGETRQNFNIWVYGDDDLRRGSGIFVPETGTETNHHFLPPDDARSFKFTTGHYVMEVFATVVGMSGAKRLFEVHLDVNNENAACLEKDGTGLYFDWGPDSAQYSPHVKTAAARLEAPALPR